MGFSFYGHPIPPEEATGELREIYNHIDAMLGSVAPHIQIHATHMPETMESYIETMQMTRNHPVIPLEWFVLLRLSVARQEDFPYCRTLNEMMLHGMGYDDTVLGAFFAGRTDVPLDASLRLLYDKALKGIYDSSRFDQCDFDALYAAGFSDKTIYEAIDYATWFSGVARKLNVYRVKTS
jgi:hypothetical protein